MDVFVAPRAVPLHQVHREVGLAQLRDEIFRDGGPPAGAWAVDHVVEPTVFNGRSVAVAGHDRASSGRRPVRCGPCMRAEWCHGNRPTGAWASSGDGTYPAPCDRRREGRARITEVRGLPPPWPCQLPVQIPSGGAQATPEGRSAPSAQTSGQHQGSAADARGHSGYHPRAPGRHSRGVMTATPPVRSKRWPDSRTTRAKIDSDGESATRITTAVPPLAPTLSDVPVDAMTMPMRGHVHPPAMAPDVMPSDAMTMPPAAMGDKSRLFACCPYGRSGCG